MQISIVFGMADLVRLVIVDWYLAIYFPYISENIEHFDS